MEAPGMLARHYSPRTPLRLFIGPPPAAAMLPGAGVLLFLSRPAAAAAGQPDTAYWLSEGGDQAEVARNLFDLLRRLDGAGHPCIWAELPEARGLGHAIRDRLERAAAVAAVAP
jgi:L-threonylcarbamoyladenylate synthase